MSSLDLTLNSFSEHTSPNPTAKTSPCLSSESSFSSINKKTSLALETSRLSQNPEDNYRHSLHSPSSCSKQTSGESQSEYSVETSQSHQKLEFLDSNSKRKNSLPSKGYHRFKMSDQSLPHSSNVCKFCDSRFLSPLELECHLSFHLKELRKRFPEEYEKLIKRRTTGPQALSAEFKRPRVALAPTSSDDSRLRKVNSETTVELLNLLVALNEKANEAKSKSNKVTVSLDFANPRFSIANPSSSMGDDSSNAGCSLPRTTSHIPPYSLKKKEFTFEKWEKSQSAEFPRPGSSNTPMKVPSNTVQAPPQEKMHFPEPCCEWFCSYFSVPCKQTNLPTWAKPEFQIPGPHREDMRTAFKPNPNLNPNLNPRASPSPSSSSYSLNAQQNINFSKCSLSGLQEFESRMNSNANRAPTYSTSSQKKDNSMKIDTPNPAAPENLALLAQAWLDGESIDGMNDDEEIIQDSDSMLDLSLHL